MKLTIEKALQQGLVAHKEGKLQDAERLYRAILQSQPLHPDANHNLGVLAVSVNKADEALPLFKTALEANPKIEQFWLSYIDALNKEQLFDNAIQVLQKAKEQGVDGEKLNVLEAQLSSKTHKPNTARENPPQTLLNILLKHYQTGRLNDAEKLAISITQEFPKNQFGWTVLGAVLRQTDRKSEAVDANQKVIALSPHDSSAHSNLGVTLQELGRLDEAEASYRQAIALKPDYFEAHYNLGTNLNELGRLDEAEASYRQAIALKLDYVEAHNNLGNTLKELDRLDEAEASYRQAIALKPDYAEAHNNLGNTLREQRNLEGAIELYKKAIALKPDYAEAHNNLGNVLDELGRLEEAIEAYKKALSIKTDYAEAYNNIGITLKGMIFKKPDPELQKIITLLLKRKTHVRPKDIFPAIISLLKFEPIIQNILQKEDYGKAAQPLQEIIFDLCKIPLLLELMNVCILTNLELEIAFTHIRYRLLSSINEISVTPEILRFQSVLANQCFSNEYIYDKTNTEKKSLAALETSVKHKLSKGQYPNPSFILCLASYKPLHEYEWSNLLKLNDGIEDVFVRQILEPRKETQLKLKIPTLNEIDNRVSLKVKKQFEENPFPKWVNLGLNLNPSGISEFIQKANLELSDKKINKVKSPNILIAGCGTGQHSIDTAKKFKNCKVLAVDLSLASLGYAKRKTEEFGLKNIEYMQADILDLKKLGKQFDIIESIGVLHHMDDPIAGWKVLLETLKPGGLMLIGLYSKLGRNRVAEMQKDLKRTIDPSDDNAIQSYRSSVIASDREFDKKVRSYNFFFSMSEFKDLLFPAQEHLFTILEISKYLDKLGLKFCGFSDAQIIEKFKQKNKGKGNCYDLNKWADYELDNTSVFKNMYTFWCQKVS